jgi:hypothetical protein
MNKQTKCLLLRHFMPVFAVIVVLATLKMFYAGFCRNRSTSLSWKGLQGTDRQTDRQTYEQTDEQTNKHYCLRLKRFLPVF